MGLNDLYYVPVLFYCNLTVNKWKFPKTYNFQILLNIASLLLEIINKSYLLQQGHDYITRTVYPDPTESLQWIHCMFAG